MEQAFRPYAAAGVALLGASLIAVTPVVKLPSLPELQTFAVQLSAEADAFALVINALDPDAFTNGITASPTDALGTLAVSGDSFIDELGTPYITAANNLATDVLPLLDITSLFNGLSTSLSTLLSDLTNLPDLSTLLSELANLPTATDIANAIISDLTGAGGVLTTIETDLTNLPSTITTDLLNALTGSGDPLSVITTDLGNISSELGPIATALQELITAGGLGTVIGL